MADSRPGGIEKIAHLFIAGGGAAHLRARDNGHLRWASPTAAGENGNGPTSGSGTSGVREGLPDGQAAADIPSITADADGACQTGRPGDVETGSSESATNGATPRAGDASTTRAAPDPCQGLGLLLSRAKVAAVLSGHMGPLAGPAAELFARTIAREGTAVAMLYGPADLACLHRFAAISAEDAAGSSGREDGPVGQGSSLEGAPCDMLLLPDWVFQSDLWPMSRGVHSICLAYGAGSEGLMSAYGALKGLISRFGRPEELFLLPFGCNEQEETWVHERLAEMCRRFLELQPRLAHERPDVHVRASTLLPIEGGSEGVRQLFAATGRPVLSIVPRVSRGQPGQGQREVKRELEVVRSGEAEGPVMAESVVQEVHVSAEVTPLVAVPALPSEGEAVLRALLEHRQSEAGGCFDSWSRNGVAGTIVGGEGLIGAAGEIRDLLGFALWLCRQAKVSDLEELTSLTIAVRQPEAWLMEAAEAMPVPVRWVRWRAYQLGGQMGLGFEAVER